MDQVSLPLVFSSMAMAMFPLEQLKATSYMAIAASHGPVPFRPTSQGHQQQQQHQVPSGSMSLGRQQHGHVPPGASSQQHRHATSTITPNTVSMQQILNEVRRGLEEQKKVKEEVRRMGQEMCKIREEYKKLNELLKLQAESSFNIESSTYKVRV